MKIKFWWKLNAVLGVFLVLLLRAAVPVGADETRYLYDEAGRLHGVLDAEGMVAVYRYDAVGNIVTIERSASTLLSPMITGISPNSGAAGTAVSVSITGTNLTGSTVTTDNPGITVSGIRGHDDGLTATFSLSYSARWGPTIIIVDNTLGSSSVDFTVIPAPPEVTKLSPTQGPVSRLVEISGSGFSSVPSENGVFFNGVAAAAISASSTGILTSVPEGAATGPVTVRVRGGEASSGKTFQVTTSEAAPPVITSISPNVGSVEGGCSVTISGSGFTADTVVCFGKETVAETSFVDSSTLRITTRAGSPGRCDVSASNGNGDSLLQGGYTYLDATRLQMLSLSPALWSSGVPLNSPVCVWFSRAVDLTTFSAAGFSLIEKTSGTSVTGVISADFGNAEVIFHPSAPLKENTEYIIDITTRVQSTDGMPLDQPVHGSISTGSAADTAAPQFTILPEDGAGGVPVNELITLIFSESMCTPTINASTVTVANNGAAVKGAIRFGQNNTVAVFIPYSNFLPSSTVAVSLSDKVTDPAGNPISGSGLVSTFTTATTSSLEPPYVLSVDPPYGAEGVSAYTSVTVSFSQPMDPTTISKSAFTLSDRDDGTKIPGNLSFSDECRVLTFTPTNRLETGHEIWIWMGGMADLAGNGMPGAFGSTFTTSSEVNPQVTKTNPADGAAGMPLNSRMVISFSKRMDPATMNDSTLYLTKGWDESVPARISLTADGLRASVMPTAALAPATGYTIHFTSDIQDLGGYPIENPGSVYFVTGEALDETSPTMTMVTPANGARSVPLNASVAVRFSEPVDETTINGNSLIVSQAGTSLAGDLNFEENGSLVRYRPKDSGTFEPDAFYLVTLTTSITDGAGNPLAREYVMGFTTSDSVDTTPPEVVSVFPADGATDIGTETRIQVTFSEPIDPSTVNDWTFWINRGGMIFFAFNEHFDVADSSTGLLYASTPVTYAVPGKLTTSADRRTVIFTPDDPLLSGTWQYQFGVWAIGDLAGNQLQESQSYQFSTLTSPGTDRHGLPASSTISIDPSTIVADGTSQATVHVTDIMDENGNTVADGTIVGVTAGGAYGVESAGGSILGSTESESYPGFKFFTVSGGAVSFTYQAPDIPDLPPGDSDIAKIQVFSVDAGGLLVSQVGEDALVTLTR